MLNSFAEPVDALVVGAGGGIGGAFVDHLLADECVRSVRAWSRSGLEESHAKLQTRCLDVGNESELQEASSEVDRLTLVIIATGVLHGAGGMVPEKSWKSIDPTVMAESFRVNAILPTMILKYLIPRVPRKERAILCALSARVGSISDNRLGGWHSYRASKAALNQIIQSFSIELKRTHPEAACLGLHPGTVDTDLSAPFQTSLAGNHQLFSPSQSAEHLLNVIDAATPANSGCLIAWDGKKIDP